MNLLERKPRSQDAASFGARYLEELLASQIVLCEDWDQLPPKVCEQLKHARGEETVLDLLLAHNLITNYQRARILAGTTFGLILGNYRVLDRIGAGGMGIVFRAEHISLRRIVAIKVLPVNPEQDVRVLQRFTTEIRAVAQLNHPNIVAAMDAGVSPTSEVDGSYLRYFVMEYVPGQDLEEYVKHHGVLPVSKACDVIYQIASALAEAHKYRFVHRDIKPSNIILTSEGQAKLLDFGLARNLESRVTKPGVILGSFDFLAPEQARDASNVDIRADIFGLGGTLYWCLTGRLPFPTGGSLVEEISRRCTMPAPSARVNRPEISPELDAVMMQMLNPDANQRFATPQALMATLLPFLKPEMRDYLPQEAAGRMLADARQFKYESAPGVAKSARVLIVDDEPSIRTYCSQVLQADGIQCDEAPNGAVGLEMLKKRPYDLVLLDQYMPEMKGQEVLMELRKNPPSSHLKIVVFSGKATSDELARILLQGADDYLIKPFSVIQLQGRVKTALRLKEAQDRAELLNLRMLSVNKELEKNLGDRDVDLVAVRNALVLSLAKLVSHRDTETGSHLMRIQRYCRVLAEEAAVTPGFASQIDQNFIEMLECCSPLHDIGKVGLPDHILLKPGKLTPDERILMQAHTIIGADTLQEVASTHGSAVAFLQMAIDIARHHHERFDGNGYPDRLSGTEIPLSARLVAIADVYDALRSRRVYKPALSHATAMHLIFEGSPGQFEPALLHVFQRCAHHFNRIFQELSEGGGM